MTDRKYEQNVDTFYRGHVWGMVESRLDRMEKEARAAHLRLEEKIDVINGKMKYVYGFSAGVAAVFSVIGFLLAITWETIKKGI